MDKDEEKYNELIEKAKQAVKDLKKLNKHLDEVISEIDENKNNTKNK